MRIRNSAAVAKYKMCFVLTLQSGRIVAQDMTTLCAVLKAIEANLDPGFQLPFYVIFNKLLPGELKNIETNWERYLEPCGVRPKAWLALPRATEAEESEDFKIDDSTGVKVAHFFSEMQSHYIDRASVSEVATDSRYDDLCAAIERQITALNAENRKYMDNVLAKLVCFCLERCDKRWSRIGGQTRSARANTETERERDGFDDLKEVWVQPPFSTVEVLDTFAERFECTPSEDVNIHV